MALEDDNPLTDEQLQILIDQLQTGDLEAASAMVAEFEDADVDGIAELRGAIEDGDADSAERWARDRLSLVEGVSDPFSDDDFSFDFDDAFADLDDDASPVTNQAASVGDLDSSSAIVLNDAVDEPKDGPRPASDPQTVEADYDEAVKKIDREKKDRGKVLTGKFEIANPNEVLASKKSARPSDDESRAPEPKGADRPFDSGSSARYAADAPPPPTHRLRATADLSGEIATGELDIEDDDVSTGFRDDASPFGPVDDDLDFDLDLGLQNPEEQANQPSDAASEPDHDAHESDGNSADTPDSDVQAPDGDPSDAESAEESEGDDDSLVKTQGFSFDFSMDDEEEENAFSFAEPVESSVADEPDDEESEANERSSTPRSAPAVGAEDMMFELAEALAAESSGAEPYRGEPIGSSGGGHSFSEDAPTNANITAIEAAQSVPVGDGQVATNLNAILLEARRLKSAGHLQAALDITKKILSRSDSREAQRLHAAIEEELENERRQTLGPLSQTPRLDVSMSELANYDLDHRAGFLLSQIDGVSTYEELVDVSGMSKTEALEIFADLVAKGVIVTD